MILVHSVKVETIIMIWIISVTHFTQLLTGTLFYLNFLLMSILSLILKKCLSILKSLLSFLSLSFQVISSTERQCFAISSWIEFKQNFDYYLSSFFLSVVFLFFFLTFFFPSFLLPHVHNIYAASVECWDAFWVCGISLRER